MVCSDTYAYKQKSLEACTQKNNVFFLSRKEISNRTSNKEIRHGWEIRLHLWKQNNLHLSAERLWSFLDILFRVKTKVGRWGQIVRDSDLKHSQKHSFRHNDRLKARWVEQGTLKIVYFSEFAFSRSFWAASRSASRNSKIFSRVPLNPNF